MTVSDSASLPRFIVAQVGARRGYAVPLILRQNGMLERFYTDIAGNVGFGRMFSLGRKLPGIGARLARLASRRVPDAIVEQTRTFPLSIIGDTLRELTGPRDAASRYSRHLQNVESLGQGMLNAGFGEATHVFSMLGEGGPFLVEARRRGLLVVAEVYILLGAQQVLAEERRAFPEWEEPSPDYDALQQQCSTIPDLVDMADYFVCPSAAVQDDLVEHWGVPPERTSLVPYGMSSAWLDLAPQPRRGRILFVGTAELRKGIHYLAMAAEMLKARGRDYEFRVAGNVTPQVREQPACRHLHFLGRVPRESIQEEFRAADVFVLPSLAEGSAEVTYEALAAALPVITTQAAGSVARDGIEGAIVPERDAAALADAVEKVVEDRVLRDKMSAAARERAREYTWDRYGQRLVAVLKGLGSALAKDAA